MESSVEIEKNYFCQETRKAARAFKHWTEQTLAFDLENYAIKEIFPQR